MLDLSIIIVTYNSEDQIGPCLASIERERGDLKLEVLVVDNDSTDKTVEIVKSGYPSTNLVVNTFNVGFSKANNQLLGRAAGKCIMLLNPDTILQTGALTNLLKFFTSRAFPCVAGLNVRNLDGSFQESVRALPSFFSLVLSVVGLSRIITFGKEGWWPRSAGKEPAASQLVGCVSGAAMAFSKEVLELLGALDEDLFYYEDTDFCARAHAAGIGVYYVPDARVIHIGGQSELSNKSRAIYHLAISRVLYFKKHFGRITARMIWVVTVMEVGVRLFVRGIQCFLPGGRQRYASRVKGYILVLRFLIFGLEPSFLRASLGTGAKTEEHK